MIEKKGDDSFTGGSRTNEGVAARTAPNGRGTDTQPVPDRDESPCASDRPPPAVLRGFAAPARDDVDEALPSLTDVQEGDGRCPHREQPDRAAERFDLPA